MKYQQYNDAIYQMRQEILKDIREYASRLMQKSNLNFSFGYICVDYQCYNYVPLY